MAAAVGDSLKQLRVGLGAGDDGIATVDGTAALEGDHVSTDDVDGLVGSDTLFCCPIVSCIHGSDRNVLTVVHGSAELRLELGDRLVGVVDVHVVSTAAEELAGCLLALVEDIDGYVGRGVGHEDVGAIWLGKGESPRQTGEEEDLTDVKELHIELLNLILSCV